jgi:hypothetical protein
MAERTIETPRRESAKNPEDAMRHHRVRYFSITSLVLVFALAITLTAASEVASPTPAQALTCSTFNVGTPYRSGNTITGTANITCYHNIKIGTLYVYLRQYRGAGFWRLKAQNAGTTTTGRVTVRVTWRCAAGTGSQRYHIEALWAHTDPNNTFWSAAKTGPERRITCP